MPYKPKAEKERELYMTLAELCAGICSLENCSEVDALVQVRKARADGELRWVKWGDGKHLSRRPTPPAPGEWWLTAKIRIPGDGKVSDDDGVTPEGLALGIAEWRTLLILRASASPIWQLAPAPIASPAAGPAESEAAPPSLSDASDEEVEAAYKQHIDEFGYQTEEQDMAWAELRGVKQAEVRTLRQRYPRKTGRPRKKGRPKRG